MTPKIVGLVRKEANRDGDERLTTPLRGGDTWACVTAHGRGQPVKIRRVTEVCVYFRAIGRHADHSEDHRLPIAAFRARYVPYSLVKERQQQLRRDERDGIGPVLVELDPIDEVIAEILPAPVPVSAAAEPAHPEASVRESEAPTSRSRRLTDDEVREIYGLAKDARSKRERVEIGNVYGVGQMVVYDIVAGRSYAATTAELRGAPEQPAPTPSPRGRASDLSVDVVRAVFRRRGSGTPKQIGAELGVAPHTVRDIWARRSYAAATEGIDAPDATYAHRRSGYKSPRFSIEQARIVYALRGGNRPAASIARAYGVSVKTVTSLWVRGTHLGVDLRSASTSEPAPDEEAPVPQPPPAAAVPNGQLDAPKTPWVDRAEQLRQERSDRSDVLVDLADALEMLLEYAGKPLPRYIRLDVESLRGLIERAREIGSGQ